jgi:hypothetical protein
MVGQQLHEALAHGAGRAQDTYFDFRHEMDVLVRVVFVM